MAKLRSLRDAPRRRPRQRRETNPCVAHATRARNSATGIPLTCSCSRISRATRRTRFGDEAVDSRDVREARPNDPTTDFAGRPPIVVADLSSPQAKPARFLSTLRGTTTASRSIRRTGKAIPETRDARLQPGRMSIGTPQDRSIRMATLRALGRRRQSADLVKGMLLHARHAHSECSNMMILSFFC